MSARKRLPQNLFLQSRAHATAPWADDATSTRSNNYGPIAAPDGSFTASRVICAGGGTQYIYQPITWKTGVYVISAWMRTTAASGTQKVRFRVKAGASITTFLQGPDISLDQTWRRYSLVGGVNTYEGASGFIVCAVMNDAANEASDFLIWESQLELSDAPGDHVTTTTAAVNPTIAAARRRQGQNLLKYSEDFAQAAQYSNTGASVTMPGLAAPTGALTANRLTDSVANSVHTLQILLGAPLPTVSGRIYTFSGFFKYESHDLIVIAGNGGDGTAYVYVNPHTGQIAATAGANVVSYGCKSVGNGWYRAWNTFIANSNAPNPTLYYAQSVGVLSYAGTGTDTMLIWGLQHEQSDAPGDYAPTTTAAVNPTIAPMRKRLPQNLVKYSNDFANADWVKNGCTITAAAAVSPSGLTDASAIVEDASLGLHQLRTSNITPYAKAKPYVGTLRLKANARGWCWIQSDTASVYGYFDLTAAPAGTMRAGGVAQVRGVSLGNGWWQVSIAFTSTDTATLLYIYPATGDGGNSYQGINGTQAIYVWGAQFEQSNAPGDYVATTTAAYNPSGAPPAKRTIS